MSAILPAARGTQAARYAAIRAQTEALAAPLSAEDCALQSMPDASPVKWHLGHTTWFFETFVLERALADFAPYRDAFRTLFNSYYVGVGPRHPRPERGLLSRPSLAEVRAYRVSVDERMAKVLDGDGRLAPLIELGLNHEQQHQELILTDLKHLLSRNPLQPAYAPGKRLRAGATPQMRFVSFPEGVRQIGHDGIGFAFDNESPRHRVYLRPYGIAQRLVTNGEYQSFIDDGGYERPELWLSEGWDVRQAQAWRAPLYWNAGEQFTLQGPRPLVPEEPVTHVSFYEAEAYARWAGARLPGEAEWEVAAEACSEAGVAASPPAGNFLESGRLHPAPGAPQFFGDAWEWTTSTYGPYPGFRAATGAVGEYNGKFMVNQYVLRGGSCATPASHIRPSYRNFFPAAARWQFSGIRLARDE